MKRHILLLAALFIDPILSAQEPPTITVRKSERVAVALPGIGGPAGAAALAVLKKDLAVNGGIDVTEEARASYIVRGNASEGSLSGEVVDRAGARILSKAFSGGGAAAAHAFADEIVLALTGRPGFASSRIAFASTKTGRKEIFLCGPDGSNVVQLTRDNNISVGPSISADARRLAYTGYKSGYADIYMVEIASGARNRIVKFPGTNSGAAFSPDGSRIAFSSSQDGNPELYVASSGGGGARRLTRTRGVESSPTWSPDGQEIVFTSDDSGRPQLFRVSAGGGSPQPVATGHSYCTEPSWAPDGTKLAFNVRDGGTFRVAVLDLERGGVRVLTSGGDAEDPCFGADSRHIIYVQGGALYLLDAQTGSSTKVLSGLGTISEPSWSR
jgi:TolB protein